MEDEKTAAADGSALLRHLRITGPRPVGSIAYDLGLDAGIVSRQLLELERAGLVLGQGGFYRAKIAPAPPPTPPSLNVPHEGTSDAASPGSDFSPREALASEDANSERIVAHIEIRIDLGPA